MPATVAIVKCVDYELPRVRDAVRQAVELIGGIRAFVRPGQRVLLKANLLRATAPEEAVCTHPAVVQALVELVQEAGGYPVIGDSPGGPFTAAWMRAVYRRSGMAEVAEATGAELNWDFGATHLACPDGKRIKGLDVGTFVTQADVVIALPKLKTHGFMQFTGATKVLFGVIPGTSKMAYHAKFPDPEAFGEMLIDIVQAVRPAFSLMDGIVGMDGQGPSAGQPFQIGALLASTDAVALDVAAAAMVGMAAQSIYPLRAAIARGLTTGRIEDVMVLGEAPDAFQVTGFRPPKTGHGGGSAFRALSSIARYQLVAAPRSNARCVGCGVCAQNCPVKAITIVDKRAQMDLKTCIRCYCCHELCPHDAIDLQKPWLGRLLSM